MLTFDNIHINENSIENMYRLLSGAESIYFELDI